MREAAICRCSSKQLLLKFVCNIHRKTPVLESLFNKIPDLQACNFIKKRLQHSCFPVNIAKFLKIPFTEHFRTLLLSVERNTHSFLKLLVFKIQSYTLQKCWSKYCRNFNVCLTILQILGVIGLTLFFPMFPFDPPEYIIKPKVF